MENLHWIFEPGARPTDEDGRIYEQVIAKAPDYLVAIYEGATPDPELSQRDGRTRYRNEPMVCIRIKGEKDFISESLNASHHQRFPRAVAWWNAHKGESAKVSVKLLPGITSADLMELEELKLLHVDALAQAEVPENLRPWRDMAKRLMTLSKPRLRLVDGKLMEVA